MDNMPIMPLRGTLITGTKGMGKTTELVRRVAALLASGAAGKDIAVVAASPTAVVRLGDLLTAACDPDAVRGMRITTARQWALEVLDTEAAYRATGRRARMVAPFETAILMEDMKTCGLPVKRLREMLKFLERGWTELSDEDPSWLIDNQERDLQALYRDYLAFYEAMPEPEIANMALKYLRFDGAALQAARVPHVLMDDYQLMNRTSQLLGLLLAGQTVTVTADEFNIAPVYDSYPYVEGIGEFGAMVGEVQTIRLTEDRRNPRMAALAERVLANCGFAAGDHGASMGEAPARVPSGEVAQEAPFDLLAAASPKEEIGLVVRWVRERLAQGVPAEEIAVVHPDVPLWGRNAAVALQTAGIAVNVAPEQHAIHGDPRKEASCGLQRAATLAMLAGDPTDSLAWRCWCGYGDWLTQSATFDVLRRYASANSMSLAQVLALAANGRLTLPDEGSEGGASDLASVLECYGQGLEAISAAREACSAESGKGYAEALWGAAGIDPAHGAAVAALAASGPRSGPEALRRGLLDALCAPAVSRVPGVVTVVSPSCLQGFSPRYVLVCGMVNGFFPNAEYFDLTVISPDKQARRRERYLHAFYALACSAGEGQAFSRFTHVDVETAGRLKLKIDRVGLKAGARVATIGESEPLALARPQQPFC